MDVFIRKVVAFCVIFSGVFNPRSKNRENRNQQGKVRQWSSTISFLTMCSARGNKFSCVFGLKSSANSV